VLWYQLGSIDDWDLHDPRSVDNLRGIFLSGRRMLRTIISGL
jgi:hypothetical protein